MSHPIDNTETETVDPTQSSGRKFAVGALAMVAALSQMVRKAPAAEAGLWSPCCNLGSNTPCSGSCGYYSCPGGSFHAWYCYSGNRIIGCGECNPGSSCYGGPYYCSNWWDVNLC